MHPQRAFPASWGSLPMWPYQGQPQGQWSHQHSLCTKPWGFSFLLIYVLWATGQQVRRLLLLLLDSPPNTQEFYDSGENCTNPSALITLFLAIFPHQERLVTTLSVLWTKMMIASACINHKGHIATGKSLPTTCLEGADSATIICVLNVCTCIEICMKRYLNVNEPFWVNKVVWIAQL